MTHAGWRSGTSVPLANAENRGAAEVFHYRFDYHDMNWTAATTAKCLNILVGRAGLEPATRPL